NQLAQRAWVDVVAGHTFGAPHLSGNISSLCRPITSRHSGEFAIEKNETLWQVVVEISLLENVAEAGKRAKPYTGLRPMRLGTMGRWVLRHQTEIDFVVSRGDRMLDDKSICQGVAQPQYLLVRAEPNLFIGVWDHSVLHPIGIGRARPTIC